MIYLRAMSKTLNETRLKTKIIQTQANVFNLTAFIYQDKKIPFMFLNMYLLIFI